MAVRTKTAPETLPTRTSRTLGIYCSLGDTWERFDFMTENIELLDRTSEAFASIVARAVSTVTGQDIIPVWRVEELARREDIGAVIDITYRVTRCPDISKPLKLGQSAPVGLHLFFRDSPWQEELRDKGIQFKSVPTLLNKAAEDPYIVAANYFRQN